MRPKLEPLKGKEWWYKGLCPTCKRKLHALDAVLDEFVRRDEELTREHESRL